MVPRVTSKGRSFKGAGAYFLHDLGKAKTSERVEFTHTVNMLTNDPEKAIKVMAWTASNAQELKQISGQKMTGRKAENPVYTYVLSWAPDQKPDREHMVAFAERSLQALGVEDHEALFIAHNDTAHKHLHVIVNRVHPVTGLMAKMDHDQNRLSRLAQAYEEETGRIYCVERVANNRRRDRGEPKVKDVRSVRLIETEPYQARRVARLQAQQRVGVRLRDKAKEQDNRSRAARDLRAAFDQASGSDDQQYRAKETVRPRADEQRLARQAWEAAQAKERESRTRDLREGLRLLALEQARAANWSDYEAGVWQKINDRQTEAREGLRERQAAQRAKGDERLARKFAPEEKTLKTQIRGLVAELNRKGVKGLLDTLIGRRPRTLQELKAARAALEHLQAEKDAERAALALRQQVQRQAQAQQQESERKKVAARLQATKARQDAAFAQREAARAARLDRQKTGGSPLDGALQRLQEATRERGGGTSQASKGRSGRPRDHEPDR